MSKNIQIYPNISKCIQMYQVTQLSVSTPLAASIPNFYSTSCYTTGPFSSPSSPGLSITHIEWKIKLKTD